MVASDKKAMPTTRTALYRKRAKRLGLNRIEVLVPAQDVDRIKTLAVLLRQGGEPAQDLRKRLPSSKQAQTGAELLANLGCGTDRGFTLDLPKRTLDKDRDTGLL